MTLNTETLFPGAFVLPITSADDGIGRKISRTLKLPAGRYTLSGLLELAPAGGLVGLIVEGEGAGATYIDYDGVGATMACRSSRSITFRDVTFESSGVDDNQVAFTIDQTGNPLRSWRFERCDFSFFWKCFAVTGSAMCSEFYFLECQFSQCYYLMDNENDQAVNWNFVNCNWENNELETAYDKNESAIFNLRKGTFARWTGGSLIFWGRLVYYNLTTPGSFQRTTHKVDFDGIRIELVDDEGADGHVPFIDRVDTDYVNGSNHPTTSLRNFSLINRGNIPDTVTYARVWGNCSLLLFNGECEKGKVVGVIDGVTAGLNASVVIEDVMGVSYEEDVSGIVNSHDQHNVTIVPDNSTGRKEPVVELRLANLDVPSFAFAKRVYWRGSTGSLPYGGTEAVLPVFPPHTVLLEIFCKRFEPASQTLQIDVTDAAGAIVYGTVTLAAGAMEGRGYIGKEIGFQIPSSALKLRFSGTPEVVKGVVGIDYL